MLTIKKRFPSEKLYLYGGTAFIAGFAGIMLALVQTNTHVRDFMVSNPVSFETKVDKPAERETTNAATTEDTILTQEQIFTNPNNQTSATTQTTPAQTSPEPQPAAPIEQPVPTEPTVPVDPTPTDPAPTDPEPAEPTNPIEVIIDILP